MRTMELEGRMEKAGLALEVREGERSETGALLRREGLYSSLLSSWRRQREAGQLDGLGGKKRGRDGAVRDKLVAENKRLRRDAKRMARKLRQAEVAPPSAVVDGESYRSRMPRSIRRIRQQRVQSLAYFA